MKFLPSTRTLGKALFVLPLLLAACALDTNGSIEVASGPGGGGGAGGTGGADAGGGSASEQCLNGADDDGNELIDCEDPACTAAYTCVPDVPADWTAVWILEQAYTGSPAPPNCPSGTPATVYFAEPATTAECSACTCDYTGTKCTAPGLAWANYNDGCDPLNPTYFLDQSVCYNLNGIASGANSSGSILITAAPKVTTASTCSGSDSSVAGPPMWGKEVYVCPVQAAEGSGCDGVEVCLPKATGAFVDAKTCVVQPGAVPCPAAYPQKLDLFDDGVDERACTTCGCDPTTITCTGGSYILYDEMGCDAGSSEAPLTVDASKGCQTADGFFDYGSASVLVTTATPSGGACTPAQPSGVVVPSGPRTVCCAP